MTSGYDGEQLAARFLWLHGYQIIARNYRVRAGELDLVCRDHDCLVFVEVKTRTQCFGGLPETAVTPRKLRRLLATAEQFLATRPQTATMIRFDIISIELDTRRRPHIVHFKDCLTVDRPRRSLS